MTASLAEGSGVLEGRDGGQLLSGQHGQSWVKGAIQMCNMNSENQTTWHERLSG